MSPRSTPDGQFVGTVLITGAGGFIGSRLTAMAMGQGWRVRTLTRSDWTGSPAVPTQDRFFGNLPARLPLESLAGVDAVVHCAGTGEPGERLARSVNLLSTMRLARAAEEAGVKTFVFISTQSARADAAAAYGSTKWQAEQELLRISAEGRMRVVMIRPGLVTGPGARGLFARISGSVEKLPIVPLLGGGDAPIQPIHVDDLGRAILRCCGPTMAERLNGEVLNLGDPNPTSLKQLVGELSMASKGREARTLGVPLAPVTIAVKMAEKMKLPLPINSNNLKGLAAVEVMDTVEDMRTVGIPVRPLRQTLGLEPLDGSAEGTDERSKGAESSVESAGPVGILLVGAGRVGLVHALTLSRLAGARLAGLVDKSAKAIGFLHGVGLGATGYPSLEAAAKETGAGAAVIATPPSTHLELAAEATSLGMAVMVEKPLAVDAEALHEFERLAAGGADIGVGYLMPQIPSVARALARLRAGEYGKVEGFEGFTLLSLVEEPLTDRWEVRKSAAGGGSLINAGAHVLSLIQEAFGQPGSVTARSMKIHSEEVEDSMVIDMDYDGFSGRHYCSWSAPDFPRQENVLRVITDRGELRVDGGVVTWSPADGGALEVTNGLDDSVGFNLAPDYVGAGFASELGALRDAAAGTGPVGMDVPRAAAIERTIFWIYDSATEVDGFELAGHTHLPRQSAAEADEPSAPRDARHPLMLDLRAAPAEALSAFVEDGGAAAGGWAGVRILTDQLSALSKSSLRQTSGDCEVALTVPDFVTQGRLLSLGKNLEVAKRLGAKGVFSAGMAAAPQVVKQRSVGFWAGALGLVAGGVASVPSGFTGSLTVHPALVDLALALRRYDMLDRMLAICAGARPNARIGFHTGLAIEALEALYFVETRVDELSVLVSANPGGDAVIAGLREAAADAGHGDTRVVAEVGPAPALVQRTARRDPGRWLHGADALLIGPAASAPEWRAIVARRSAAWAIAFPGLEMPKDAPC